ncbi:MAG: phage portal protein, partial [Phycisphaerae bacterium]|nr:phage portal protein [Phycisphaerae bacterium]
IRELDDEIEQGSGGVPTYSGVNVSENSALNFSAVAGCVRVRGEGLAAPSLHLYKRTSKGADKAVDHGLYYMVHDSPNIEMTSVHWREAGSGHHDTWGNHYSWIDVQRIGRSAGLVRQLYPLKPDRVRPYRDEAKNRLKYEFTLRKADGTEEKITYDMSEILHVPGWGYDGVMGYSPVSILRQAIGLGLAAEQYGSTFFGQGTHVGGVVSYPQAVKQEQVDEIRTKLKEDYAGLKKSHSVMVLAAGGTFTPGSMPLEDAQFLATRKFQLEEIARIYRVPMPLLQNTDRATFSNIEHEFMEFATMTMTIYCREWEQAMNMKLLTQAERDEGYFLEFDLNSLLRGDAKSRAEFYEKMILMGAFCPNDVLEKENMNKRTDKGGDAYLVGGTSGQGTTVDKKATSNASNRVGDGVVDEKDEKDPASHLEEVRLRARLEPVNAEAWARIVAREQKDIPQSAEKWAKKADPSGFVSWLSSYFAEHQEFCGRVLTPYYDALGDRNEAESQANVRVMSLKAALFGVKPDETERIKAALEEVAANAVA